MAYSNWNRGHYSNQYNNSSGRHDQIEDPNLKALHTAIFNDDYDAVKQLLGKGVDPSIKMAAGKTAMHYACIQNSSLEIFDLLLRHGGDKAVNTAERDERMTPFHFAVMKCDEKIMDRLISAGADVNAKTKSGLTALHYAARQDRADVLKYLAKKGADIHKSQDGANRSPIYEAVKFNNYNATEALIKAGANLSYKDSAGRTVLHEFIQENRSDFQGVFKLLIHSGGSVLEQDNLGKSVMDIARLSNHHSDLYQLISKAAREEREARIKKKPSNNHRPNRFGPN